MTATPVLGGGPTRVGEGLIPKFSRLTRHSCAAPAAIAHGKVIASTSAGTIAGNRRRQPGAAGVPSGDESVKEKEIDKRRHPSRLGAFEMSVSSSHDGTSLARQSTRGSRASGLLRR